MVRKNPASDLKMKIYNESLSRGKIHIGKKKKRPTLSCKLKKKIKRHAIGWSKEKKTPLGLLSYNAKSAQYWVEQNSVDNDLVSQELIYYSFA